MGNTALAWKRDDELGFQDANLGDFNGGDGVRMNLCHLPTCYRRGPWKLLIEVEDVSRTWGCFDEQDQPVRWYHSEETAKLEAQAIADVLMADHARKVAR